MIIVRPGKDDDVENIGRLRKADADELKASLGECPGIVMRKSWGLSGERYVIEKNNKVISLFGCAKSLVQDGVGIPWLIGTDELIHTGKTLLYVGKTYCPKWLKMYDLLFNFVDSRNRLAINWLKRIGFTIHKPIPHGAEGRLFHVIEMRCKNV